MKARSFSGMRARPGSAAPAPFQRLIRRFLQLVPRCQAADQSLPVRSHGQPLQARLVPFRSAPAPRIDSQLLRRVESIPSACTFASLNFICCISAPALPPLRHSVRAALRRLRPPPDGRCDHPRRFIVRPARPPSPCLRESAFISYLDSGRPFGAPPPAAPGSGSQPALTSAPW